MGNIDEDLVNDTIKLQSKICKLIEEFENKHNFIVSKIKYRRQRKYSSPESLAGYLSRNVVVDLELNPGD